MALSTRIKRLELSSGGWGCPPCEECGWGAGDDGEVKYELTFPGGYSDDDLDDDPQPEFCSTCGREIGQILTFGDEGKD